MNNINMLELGKYSDAEIQASLDNCKRIIAEKPPGTLATTKFWKAVENRQKLQREQTVRGMKADVQIEMPDDRLPLFNAD